MTRCSDTRILTKRRDGAVAVWTDQTIKITRCVIKHHKMTCLVCGKDDTQLLPHQTLAQYLYAI